MVFPAPSARSFLLATLTALVLLVPSPAQAKSCFVPEDCAPGFCVSGICCDTACDGPCESCRAAIKGNGADGTCGNAKGGTLCSGMCNGITFTFIDVARCDPQGACVSAPDEPCLHNNPCTIDLCGDKGCEQVVKLDGTECPGGKVCTNGICGDPMPTSSSSSSGSTTGAGGAGAGGAGGGNAGGAGGAATTGSTTGSTSTTGVGGGYPPVHDTGCSCGAAGGGPTGGARALGLVLLAGLLRRRRG